MANTIVVGDSVAVGIGRQISGAHVFAQGGLRINQMQDVFTRAIAEAGQGDTVIISAGYNSTGANGLSNEDVARLQGWADQLHAKGARVVIAPLRETGMTGEYARLNGQTANTNRQLRGLRNVTFADQCIATANGIQGGEIHGAYGDLARICQAAATASASATGAAPATATGASATTPGAGASAEADRDAEGRNQEGGWRGFCTMLCRIPLIGGLIRGLLNMFGMNIPEEPAAAATAPATGTSAANTTPTATPDERTRAAARDAAGGSSAAGTGTNVTAASAQLTLPAARGPLVRGA